MASPGKAFLRIGKLLGAALAFAAGIGMLSETAALESGSDHAAPAQRLSLRKVLDSRVSGLEFLKQPVEQVSRLWKRTRMLVDYRLGRLAIQDTAELLGDCIVWPEKTPQCHFLAEGWQQEWGDEGDDEEGERARGAAVLRPNREQVVGALQEAELDTLSPRRAARSTARSTSSRPGSPCERSPRRSSTAGTARTRTSQRRSVRRRKSTSRTRAPSTWRSRCSKKSIGA